MIDSLIAWISALSTLVLFSFSVIRLIQQFLKENSLPRTLATLQVENTQMFKIVILVQGNASKRWWMLLRKFWVSENFDATRNILEAFVSLKVSLLCFLSLKVLFWCIFLYSGLWTTSRLPWSGKTQGKTKIYQGQGKVREFSKKSEKIFDIVRVSEKSGNSVFPFIVHKFSSIFWNAFSFGKYQKYTAKQAEWSVWHSMSDTCSSSGQWFLLWMLSSKFRLPLSAKSWKRLKMKRKLSMACKIA